MRILTLVGGGLEAHAELKHTRGLLSSIFFARRDDFMPLKPNAES
jgi:hypothetical protein